MLRGALFVREIDKKCSLLYNKNAVRKDGQKGVLLHKRRLAH
jgi:hypothetical protein